MFNKYYQEELTILRELGAEFARANPAAAPFLAERGADPDVERLMEGFAFLTGRLRQKLDDEFPELTQSLLQVLWPHYLRPVPAMTILQFAPLPNKIKGPQRIEKGAEVDSVPVDGTNCRFRTCSDVMLVPLSVTGAGLEIPTGSVGALKLSFRSMAGSQGDCLGGAPLRLFLHGEPADTYALYLYLTRYVKEIIVQSGSGAPHRLPASALQPAGFGDDEALLPYPTRSFPGYRLLQEYFTLPDKFLFVEIDGLNDLCQGNFEILFDFDRPASAELRAGPEHFRLNCTPVVNLFTRQSDPVRVEHRKVEYRLRPEGMDPAHAEIYSVDGAAGWERGTAEQREIPAFESFRHDTEASAEEGIVYHAVRLRESVLDDGVDTHAAFLSAAGETAVPPTETVVFDLTCTNRELPSQLRVGDVNKPCGNSPQFASFKNITAVTPDIPPPLGPGLHWKLISNLALNYLSLTTPEALRSVLTVYNFRALRDRQAAREHDLRMSALVELNSRAEEQFLKGAPVRGTRIELRLLEKNFTGEGDMVLFASVLSRFLGLYCTLNSHTRLTVQGAEFGEVYEWSPMTGQQPLV